MAKYIVLRLCFMVVTIFFIIFLNTALFEIAQKEVSNNILWQAEQSRSLLKLSVSDAINNELDDSIIAYLGFDRSFFDRFSNTLISYLQFDLGKSFFQDKLVVNLLKERLPVSISLGLISTIFVYIGAFFLGIRYTKLQNAFYQKGIYLSLLILYVIPSFIICALLFWVIYQVNPQSLIAIIGYSAGDWEKLIIPIAIIIANSLFLKFIFVNKIYLLESIKEYNYFAQARGISETRVFFKYTLPHMSLVLFADIPHIFLQVFFINALFIEIMFSVNGLGKLAYDSFLDSDYPVLLGITYVSSLVYLVVRLFNDILYCFLDRRISFVVRK